MPNAHTLESLPKFIQNNSTPNDNGCWIWNKSCDKSGYGCLRVRSLKTSRAHRISFFVFKGTIPEGFDINHTCGTRNCVCPNHLEIVSHAEHAEREGHGRLVNSTHLPHGDKHWTHLHPELVARGEKSGTNTHPERVPRGEKHWKSKLSDEQRQEVRLNPDKLSLRALARKFKVGHTTIWQIQNYEPC